MKHLKDLGKVDFHLDKGEYLMRKKLLVLIHDIDPFIYLKGLEDLDYEIDVIYTEPQNPAMLDIFNNWLKETTLNAQSVEGLDNIYELAEKVGREKNIDGILSFNEFMTEPVAIIAQNLNLPGNSVQAVKTVQNKYLQRMKLKEHQVPSAKFHLIREESDLVTAGQSIDFPAVLKPAFGSGSYHVYDIENMEQLKEVFNTKIRSYSNYLNKEKELFLLEEKLIGANFYKTEGYGDYVSVESMVYKGEISHICVCDKTPLAPPFRETGAILPSVLETDQQNEIYDVASKAIKALGLTNGPVHTEIKLTEQGPRIIEVNARAGGAMPIMLQLCSDYDIPKEAAKITVGEKPKSKATFKGYGASFFFHEESVSEKEVESIDGVEEAKAIQGIHTLVCLKKPGDKILADLGMRSLYAFAYTFGNTSTECLEQYKKIKETISVRYKIGSVEHV